MPTKQCSGSGLVLDAPDGTERLTCPNCGRSVPAIWYDTRPFGNSGGAPRFYLRGHRERNEQIWE